MKVTEKYGMFFVGKWLLVERMLKLLKKREKAFNKSFKAQRKAGKLTSDTDTRTYLKLVDLIRYVEGIARDERERVRLYELPRDEQIFEIYGEYPKGKPLSPEEQAKADRAHVLLQHNYVSITERRRNEVPEPEAQETV